MEKNLKNTTIQEVEIEPIKEILPLHKEIIDTYFNNGFNKVRAYMHVLPKTNYNTAAANFNKIEARPEVKAYIAKVQSIQSDRAYMKAEDIAKELESKIVTDRTIYAGLTPEELKALPSHLKKPIKDVKHKTKTFKGKDGKTTTETICEVILYDELEIIKELNKMRGNYGEHNKQRGVNINALIQNLVTSNPNDASSLLKAIEGSNTKGLTT